METFFSPVHNPPPLDDLKMRKNHQRHVFHHHQNTNRYRKLEDSDRNTDDSRGHRHKHNQHLRDSPHNDAHYLHRFQDTDGNEKQYNHRTAVHPPSASSSSLSSSSSSSSSSSWFTEASANDPFSLRHVERPLHSLSCSNISDARRGFKEDNSCGPIVFATIKHGRTANTVRVLQSKEPDFSTLHRGHSRSEEGLLQGNEGREQPEVPCEDFRSLYKTSSLNRNLAFSEDDIVLGVPKRAISSIQLPTKGILKNKDQNSDIRKSKSMEVLSQRDTQVNDPSGQKGKGVTQAEIERARANFVEGKLQFSAFLNEITKQVMSPSDLSILGVGSTKHIRKISAPARTSFPVTPQLPPKKNRQGTRVEMKQSPKQPSGEVKADFSHPDKFTFHAPGSHSGSPPLGQHPHSVRKDRRPSPAGGSVLGDKYSKNAPYLTDGTSTSPEPCRPKQRHHRRHLPDTLHSPAQQPLQQIQSESPEPSSIPLSSAQGAGPGFGSESSSTKSDSSRARDTASTSASQSSEQGQRHPRRISNTHRDTLCDDSQLQALQEENADLHQNLLQTVVCIESLEAELQRTRDELSHVKEKYKSLLQTHTGTKQANNVLGEHLHVASESLTSERKYLLNRVSQLSSELEDARRTIAALENINVSCLIKDLLEKHFGSVEAMQKFLASSALNRPQPADSQSQSHEEPSAASAWLAESEASSQRVTAFVPIKQRNQNEGSFSDQQDSAFSEVDISSAKFRKTGVSYAARPQPVYSQGKQKASLCTNHVEPETQSAQGSSNIWGERGGLKASLLNEGAEDVSSTSAQQILDDFMQRLQTHRAAGGGKEMQGGKE
ncbi:uncharacterized protein LOC112153704 [Oryzias melastigma]|uniref:uncharacterized protein LOC112153704 n=1 Tax=Oryzias melastigma TaxID=30732 RepID=UPI000CF7F920|nr:uncharacterized protein LOC112153704 [Oryzias melastigma]